MSEWKSIDTVPKDGTRFLGVNLKYNEIEIMWRETGINGGSNFFSGNFLNRNLEEPWLSNPTHWMPLPELPKV